MEKTAAVRKEPFEMTRLALSSSRKLYFNAGKSQN
jgi:hypothetical protein